MRTLRGKSNVLLHKVVSIIHVANVMSHFFVQFYEHHEALVTNNFLRFYFSSLMSVNPNRNESVQTPEEKQWEIGDVTDHE